MDQLVTSNLGSGVSHSGAETASAVGELFSEMFDVTAGEDAEFFELGGDSLAGETLLAAVPAATVNAPRSFLDRIMPV